MTLEPAKNAPRSKNYQPINRPGIGSDWTAEMADPLQATIEKYTDERGDTELVRQIRQIVALELDKIAFRMRSRLHMMAPNNVAFYLSEWAERTRSWEPVYELTWLGSNGQVRSERYTDRAEAEMELGLLEKDGAEKVKLIIL